MADIPRSFEDYIIDSMVTALNTFSATQTSGNRFLTVRDRTRPPSMRDLPMVNIWLDTLTTVREGSSARLVQQELARINLDCYAKGTDTNADGLDDSIAMARLYYLKEQVKYGLYDLINADFNQTMGKIARKKWPQYTNMPGDLALPETEVVAGRWTVEIEYNWVPKDITGTELDEIAVNAGLWSGLYTYGG